MNILGMRYPNKSKSLESAFFNQMSSIMPKSERIEYSCTAHLESYNKILETWLLNKAPIKLKQAMEFYGPLTEKTQRFYIVENDSFHQVKDDELKIPQGFGDLDWAEHVHAQANILHDAYLINGCVIFKEFIFSECISRNVDDRLKKNINGSINRNIGLNALYRYHSYDALSNTATINIQKEDDLVISDKPCFLFNSITGCKNFGHFIHDILVQVAIYDYAKSIYPNLIPIIVIEPQIGDFKYPMMEWLFSKLICENPIKVLSNNKIFIRTLILPKKVTDVFGKGIDKLDVDPVHYLRKKITNLINSTIKSNHKKQAIYVSRKDGVNIRSFSNQEQLEQLLQQKKIPEIIISKLTPIEIITAFNSANMIIGAHGAGLMNYIFSDQPVTLLEIEPKPKQCTPTIKEFGALYGVDCFRVPVHKTEHSDLPRVDLDMLSHLIDQQVSV